MFEQLARSAMRYQESDLHLGLYSFLTSANNLNLNLLTFLVYLLGGGCKFKCIFVVAVFIAKAGHVWVN